MASSREDPGDMASFGVLVFSKDRAFQLAEFLRTFACFCRQLAQPGKASVNVTVLYACSSAAHLASYAALLERYSSSLWLRFIYEDSTHNPETPDETQAQDPLNTTPQESPPTSLNSTPQSSSFSTHFQAILSDWTTAAVDVVMLAVDDLVWLRPFDLCEAHAVLAHDSSVLAVQYALHPKVTYSHPANQPCTLLAVLETCEVAPSLSVYNRLLSSYDWNYPWSFCGSCYRLADVRKVVQGIQDARGVDGLSHPNRLEAYGHAVVQRAVLTEGWSRAQSAIPNEPVCVVVTINRVQDVYKNRVYDVDEVSDSPEALLPLFWAGRQLDLKHYQAKTFNSVHVGDFVLLPEEGDEEE